MHSFMLGLNLHWTDCTLYKLNFTVLLPRWCIYIFCQIPLHLY